MGRVIGVLSAAHGGRLSVEIGFRCLFTGMRISSLSLLLALTAGCAGTGGPPVTPPVPGPPDAAAADAAAPSVGHPALDAEPPPADVRAADVGAPVDVRVDVAAPFDAAASCAITPGVSRKTIQVDGKQRTYLLSVPAGTRAGGPLVFAWHGLGGSGMLARSYFGVEQASQGGAVFVYPDALPQPSFANRTGWNLAAESEDVHFFDALLAELSATLCVDGRRVFSVGHSFGGYMTNHLGCTRASKLRAIAPVSGGLPPGVACPTQDLPAWIAHGMNDNVVPFAEGEAAHAQWVRADGCSATTHATSPMPCVVHEGCRGEAAVHFCVHQQLHSWPVFGGQGVWAFLAAFR
jgi:polyhydroxybutyrate depolymerase